MHGCSRGGPFHVINYNEMAGQLICSSSLGAPLASVPNQWL